MNGDRPQRAGPTEIADLLAWARALTEAGPVADPAQRVAYLRAKAELLTRIAEQHTEEGPCHAAQAAALLPDSSKDTQ